MRLITDHDTLEEDITVESDDGQEIMVRVCSDKCIVVSGMKIGT